MKRVRGEQISKEQQTEYWFNTKSLSVEVGKQALAIYRIGPFASREEAQNAFQILKSRSVAWDEEDQRDKD